VRQPRHPLRDLGQRILVLPSSANSCAAAAVYRPRAQGFLRLCQTRGQHQRSHEQSVRFLSWRSLDELLVADHAELLRPRRWAEASPRPPGHTSPACGTQVNLWLDGLGGLSFILDSAPPDPAMTSPFHNTVPSKSTSIRTISGCSVARGLAAAGEVTACNGSES